MQNDRLDTEPRSADLSPPASAADRADWALRAWHLALSYDGTDFHGWQIQPSVRTVQGELTDRLRRLFNQPDLRTTGTSRTDAGVHALDQHVSFECPTPPAFDADRLGAVLNRWLPSDIRLTSVAEADLGLNVRYANVGKAYTYCICRGQKPAPFMARYVWHLHRSLDLSAMEQAARRMVGEKDFASFGVNPKRDLDTTVRHVHDVQLESAGDMIYITVKGTSFLYKMVRSMVGYLVHVGTGKAGPETVSEVLEAKDRGAAAESAPPQGLFLMRVFFDEGALRTYRPTLPPFS